jgi:hypothetical protein
MLKPHARWSFAVHINFKRLDNITSKYESGSGIKYLGHRPGHAWLDPRVWVERLRAGSSYPELRRLSEACSTAPVSGRNQRCVGRVKLCTLKCVRGQETTGNGFWAVA